MVMVWMLINCVGDDVDVGHVCKDSAWKCFTNVIQRILVITGRHFECELHGCKTERSLSNSFCW